jgi:hypothetical protein
MSKKKWKDMDKVQRVSAVIRYASKEMTAAEIAAKLDCSRNAVIGLAHRNGIVFASSKGTGRTFDPANSNVTETIRKIKKEAKEKAKVTRIKKAAKKAKPEPTVCEIIEFVPPPKRPDPPYAILQLESRDCRAPLLDGYKGVKHSEMMFCGKPTKEGSSYCAECHAIFHDGVTRRTPKEPGEGNAAAGRQRKPFFRWQR